VQVIPMLPPRLCEDLCSLNPDVDRYAHKHSATSHDAQLLHSYDAHSLTLFYTHSLTTLSLYYYSLTLFCPLTHVHCSGCLRVTIVWLCRCAFSVIWELTDEGDIVDEWFGRTVIRSCWKVNVC
jgi:hypothetical protein